MIKFFGVEIEGVQQILALTAGLHFLLMLLGCVALIILIRSKPERTADLLVKAALVVAFIGANLYLSTSISRSPIPISFDTKPSDARERIVIVHQVPGAGRSEFALHETPAAEVMPDALLVIDVDTLFDDASSAIGYKSSLALERSRKEQLEDENRLMRGRIEGLTQQCEGFREALIRLEGGGLGAGPSFVFGAEAGD